MRTRSTALALALLAACTTTTASTFSAPAWFDAPPKSAEALYFVGDASQAPDAESARELAVQKALFNLSVYVGATIKSDASSTVRETNQMTDQTVEMTVEIAGEEIVVREATLRKFEVGATREGFSAYALLEWPKAEYENFLAAQKSRAERALTLFVGASKAAEQNRFREAQTQLTEASSLLGSSPAVIPLSDPEIRDTSVLRSALGSLNTSLAQSLEQSQKVCAVGVRCFDDDRNAPCDPSREGALRSAVGAAGLEVASQAISAEVLDAVLESRQPEIDAGLRAVGCVLAVELRAKKHVEQRGVLFIRYSARAAHFDPSTSRVVSSHEIPPTKEGFPILEGQRDAAFTGAKKRGFDAASRTLGDWVQKALAGDAS